ncbi:MAG TPA: ArdC-like ssDNA-binding domain-containing protein [Terriglobales bacterium]
MTEEIISQQADTNGSASPQGNTGRGREREETEKRTAWAQLLNEALTKSGIIHEAYTRFWSYSIGNQILAYCQCVERRIPLGPLATYLKWKQLGRHVKKGSKALSLWMPFTYKRTQAASRDDEADEQHEIYYTRFALRGYWFVLSQTDGAEYQPEPLPAWNEEAALVSLQITREEFTDLNGNVQGYAIRGRKVAVSPIAAHPRKTFFHELAHQVLNHVDDGDLSDGEHTARNVREVEAEAVALLCCKSLGLPGAEFSRAYIQSWAQGEPITEKSAQRIFHATDQILRAGRAPMHTGQEAN